MSKLEELIKEHCPNGVEKVYVSDICNISRGVVISKDDIRDNPGKYPVFSSQTENGGCLGRIGTYAYDGKYITWTTDGANAGTVFYREGKFSITNVCGLLKIKANNVDIKYLYYILSIEAPKFVNSGMGNPKLMSNVMARIQIPLPPLAVQREIVRILDKFTLYSQELAAELAARKKQYEFYRESLLTFKSDIKYYKIGNLCVVKNGYTPSKSNHEFWDSGTIPWIRLEDIRANGKTIMDSVQYITEKAVRNGGLFQKQSIIISTTATIGEYAVLGVDALTNQQITNIAVKEEYKNILSYEYLYYYCHFISLWCKQNAHQGGGLAIVNLDKLRNYEIPLPPLEIQERIVKVLDNFDAICSDLGIGLPAEIEKRQQQYEFYRDKLLTFGTGLATIFTDRQTGLIRLLQYVYGYAFVRLGDIATITRGGNFQKKDFRAEGKPCIHYGQIYTKYGLCADRSISFVNDEVYGKAKKASRGDIVMAVTSENIEDVCKCVVWMGDEDVAISGHTAIIHHDQNAKYLAYYFNTQEFFEQKKRLVHGTKVIEVTPSSLENIVIPLPSLEEQARIVSILDRFDELCNDLSEGLPAEIEARQKQYEYYRNKLLQF